MDYPAYLTELLVQDRLARLRADCANAHVIARARATPRWRVVLGTTLVRLGERLRAATPVGGLAAPPS